jgi:hypothetical protein
MSTRKLILTALVCGLAILLAGGIKLFQVANDDKRVEVLSFGSEATLGDMTVSVLSIERTADATSVTVTMTGVDLAEGAAAGWRMLADGRVSEPLADTGSAGVGAACASVSTSTVTRCVVRFAPAESAPTVAYLRAGEQRQWAAD